MSDRWLVFDVGCIECGEVSRPVGLYATEDEANAAAEDYREPPDGGSWGRKEWHGQHLVEVFDLATIEESSIVRGGAPS